MCSGCKTKQVWNDVPLTEGDTPFSLSSGTEIVDSEGVKHILNGNYWVVPEADLYDAIIYLKQKTGTGTTRKINILGVKNEEAIHISDEVL